MDKTILAGFDIGGTKCSVVLAEVTPVSVHFIAKERFATPSNYSETLEKLDRVLLAMLFLRPKISIKAIGISCGGPLNSRAGTVNSPPNLPGWDNVDVITPFIDRFHVPVALQNDANACVLAECRWGAGRGAQNVVFLTFGTGMGAGLFLGGKLYRGGNDLAGEIGHIRMMPDGPEGYGKRGSFEGFCSGGGITRLARVRAEQWLLRGDHPAGCLNMQEVSLLTAESLALAAKANDPFALDIYEQVGRQLGRGLAILIDLLNPECIVIGSIYARQRALLDGWMFEELFKEALPSAANHCRVIPSELGELLGDYASLSVGLEALGICAMPDAANGK